MRPQKTFYEMASLMNTSVWRVCDYKRKGLEKSCRRCPAWRHDERHGKVKAMCRALAEETIAMVLEEIAINKGLTLEKKDGGT